METVRVIVFANKTITTGEGGMVVFKKNNYLKALKIKNHGMSSNKKYFHDIVGSNYRLTNLQAAIGVEQLKKVKKLLKNRKKFLKLMMILLMTTFSTNFQKMNGLKILTGYMW